jgi:hypothetical protein
MASHRLTSKSWCLSFSIALAVVVCISAVVARSYIGHHALNLDDSGRISSCRAQVLYELSPSTPVIDVGLLEHIHYMCYQQISEEDSLTDFGIRKAAFLNQQAETPVMLWMVVAITLSGVLLAAIQLLAAYRLASSGKGGFEQGGQISVEARKISLSSSVTGLVILTVSLAFFIVFVTQVYVVKEVRSSLDHADSQSGLLSGTTQSPQVPSAPPSKVLTGAPYLPNAISQPYRMSSKRGGETVPGVAAVPSASAQKDKASASQLLTPASIIPNNKD